ncbi:MAG TPA: hypothetical protein VFE62_20415 [Gemmataceae bacterium]|nr:hypothetical protein [Gemmataceae bacterium]
MFYVTCPSCGSQVEIPIEAVGADHTDRWNVARCDECGNAFDDGDEEIIDAREAG